MQFRVLDRQRVWYALLAAVNLCVCACVGGRSDHRIPYPTPSMTPRGDVHIGMVIAEAQTGTIHSQTLYQGALREALRRGVRVDFKDGAGHTASDLAQTLREEVRQGNQLIIVDGKRWPEVVERIAGEFPRTTFVITSDLPSGTHVYDDATASTALPNLITYRPRVEEAAYLAGVAAAMLSSSATVGQVALKDLPEKEYLRAGFFAGAQSLSPLNRALCSVASDPKTEHALIMKQIHAGSDIEFVAAEAQQPDTDARNRTFHPAQHAPIAAHVARINYTQSDQPPPPGILATVRVDFAELAVRIIEDYVSKNHTDIQRRIGLADPAIVRFDIGSDFPLAVRDKLMHITRDIRALRIQVPTHFSGNLFSG